MERPAVQYARAGDGAHIAYQAFGEGRFDIVFAPGQITHLDLAWEDPEQAAFLRRLTALGRVIVVDRRGVGLSDRLAPGEAPPVEVLVEDLEAVLLAAGASRPVLFGTDEGGQLACLFAAVHPERLHGLVLYGTWSHMSDEMRRSYERWMEWSVPRWGSLESALNDTRDMQPSRSSDRRHLEWLARTQRSALSPGSIVPLMEVSIALDVRDVLPTIGVPTLALYRPGDSEISPALMRETTELIPGAIAVELPGVDHWWSSEPIEPLFEALRSFLGTLGGGQPEVGRRLATVLFTDIVGSTERAVELGDARWRTLLAAHHAAVRTELGRFGGTEVDTAGEGFLATFDGPARAVRCAVAIAERMTELGLRIRAGVHTGEVEVVDGKVAGIALHVGARVAGLAGPSEVLVSSTVRDLVTGSGLVFVDAGEHALKGVAERWHLYRVAEDRADERTTPLVRTGVPGPGRREPADLPRHPDPGTRGG